MDEKDLTKEPIEEVQDEYETLENQEEQEVYEALSEIKTQKRTEQILMGLIVAGVFTAMIFAYNIWQRDVLASQYQPYVVSNSAIGTQAGYTEDPGLAAGGGGCCGAGGGSAATGVATTGAEAAALAGSTGSAGGCGGSGGGCGGGGTGTQLSPQEEQQVQGVALEYYAKTYGDDKVTVEIKSFGCHMECYFYKDGQLVKSLIYRGGQFIEK